MTPRMIPVLKHDSKLTIRAAFNGPGTGPVVKRIGSMRGDEPLGWDVARWGRWAGIFVLISALALAIWEVAGSGGSTPLSIQVRVFWLRLVGIAPWGVIIILLAELVDRVSGDDSEDIEDEDIEDEESTE